ncbi:MAG: plasmid recombination protein [Oscillospiraceae bacterium]|nr:plasmid recombination protein [Oscillospiraceae bacterium]
MNDKNYSVARVEQHTKASVGKSERHIERKNESYENMNVDLSRTPMNVHYQSCNDLTYNAHLDRLVEDGSISLRGLKKDAKVFDEMIFDVNTAYFEERGGYEYACRFYEEVFRFAQKEYGPENIVSAVMHADELNTALTEQLGHPVYHYHMHVVALPVVEKEILWSKRCKDPALVGTVKEVVHQISHSKKWASPKISDENGHTQIIKSYSLLQDRFFEHMRDAGFEDFERGERGSTAQHLSVTEFKVKKEREMLADIEAVKNEMLDELGEVEKNTEKAKKEAAAAQKQIDRVVPKMEKVVDFARDHIADVDQVLPQPDLLESAKSFRERKVKPLFRKLIAELRALYSKYVDLKYEHENLQRRYGIEVDKVESMHNRIQELVKDRDSVSTKYNAIWRGFGKDYIESQAKAILEREEAERQLRKQRNKRHEIGAR